MVTQQEIDDMVKRLELDGSKVSSVVETRAFINGEYVTALSGEVFESENPSTGKVVARISSCKEEDVNAAVEVARKAFESGVWSGMEPRERMAILLKFADLIEENLLELAVLDAVDAGRPISDILEGDLPETVECFKFHAEAIDKINDFVTPTSEKNVSIVVREPIGVVGLIVPWNFALLMAAWKTAPALACGNAVILKPAELTSLTAIRLGELANQAGIPKGIFNVVPGLGVNCGTAISSSSDIDMVGFTGSTVTGRKVLEASAKSNMKKVTLEMGGKSPQIVFEDAEDIDEKVIPQVHESMKDLIVDKLIEASKGEDWKLGDPLQLTTRLGSMISQQHMNKVMGYIQKGKDEGATLKMGGNQILKESGGHFVEPTIFVDVSNDSAISKEEIFGPVLSVLTFKTEEEAVRLANQSDFGLAASVYTSNLKRAHRVSRKLRAGTVSINCFSEGNIATPFGGYKQSGFVGRDKSIFAHEQYTEMKTIWIEL